MTAKYVQLASMLGVCIRTAWPSLTASQREHLDLLLMSLFGPDEPINYAGARGILLRAANESELAEMKRHIAVPKGGGDAPPAG